MRPFATLALFLAACNQKGSSPAANQAAAEAGAASPAAALPAARPFTVELKTDLYEFDFSWPAEAAAIPELVRILRTELDMHRSQLTSAADETKDGSDREGAGPIPYSSSTAYTTAGQSRHLLSLRVDVGSYEGGAHGNFGVGSRLWDRLAHKEVDFADLFAGRGNRGRLLTSRWCEALNKAREEKRGAPVGSGGLFDDCPKLHDIAVIPADNDKNGKFERLLLVASPYVAGPWVEGSYEIELAVTPELVAAMKSEFRSSFEAQGRQ